MKKTSERKLTRAFAVRFQLCSSHPGIFSSFTANLSDSLSSREDGGISHSLQSPSGGSHPGRPRPALLAPLASGDFSPSPSRHLPPWSLRSQVAREEGEFVRVPPPHRGVLPGPSGPLEGLASTAPLPSGNAAPGTPAPPAAAGSVWGLLGRPRQSGPPAPSD